MKRQNLQKAVSSKVLVCVASAIVTVVTLAALGVYGFIECPTQVSQLAECLITTNTDLTKVLTGCSDERSHLKQQLRNATRNLNAEMDEMTDVRKEVKAYGRMTVDLMEELGLIQYLNVTTQNYTNLLREAIRELTEVYSSYNSVETRIKELILESLELKEAVVNCTKDLNNTAEQLRNETVKLQSVNSSYVNLSTEVNQLKENHNLIASTDATLESEIKRLSGENQELTEVLDDYNNNLNDTLNKTNVCINTSKLLKEILDREKFSYIWNYCSKQTLQCARCMQNWVEHSSRCFFLSTDQKNWLDARAKCISLGGDLAVASSEGLQTFLHKLVKTNQPTSDLDPWAAWIGLTDLVEEDSCFVWVNGEKVGATYWGEGEPNNHVPDWDQNKKRGQDCVTIEAKWDAKASWDDVICTGARHYICETAALPDFAVAPPT